MACALFFERARLVASLPTLSVCPEILSFQEGLLISRVASSFREVKEDDLITFLPDSNSRFSNAVLRMVSSSRLMTGQPKFAGSPGVSGHRSSLSMTPSPSVSV